MINNSCTVVGIIPAAGKGSRLQSKVPKIFVKLSDSQTIYSIIYDKLSKVCNKLVLVLSPGGELYYRQNYLSSNTETLVTVQPNPIGMGDAIFQAEKHWKDDDLLLIVWGDQVNISKKTLERTVEIYKSCDKPVVVLPIVYLQNPYVEYKFDGKKLKEVLQSREGDFCSHYGISDVGVFVISAKGLNEAWHDYVSSELKVGANTKELNFLPFLVYLSKNGWNYCTFEVNNAIEAQGINTSKDLQEVRKRLGYE